MPFKKRKKIVSVFFDLTEDSEKAWCTGLLMKILDSASSGRIYSWIRCFLHDRSARVKLDWTYEQKRENARRSPTGKSHLTDTFSPVHQQHHDSASRHVSNTLHADDLAVWCASEHTTYTAYRIQEAVNRVEQWTSDWGLQISEVKTQATVFSLSTSKEKVTIKLGDKNTSPSRDSHLSRGKALHPPLMEATHREHGHKRHQKVCCPDEIVWNTLGFQLQP